MPRAIYQNLTVTRVSGYEKTMLSGDLVKWIYRYAFKDCEGKRYVYSGKQLSLIAGQVISLRATLRCEPDTYGFWRLSYPVVICRELRPAFI